MSAGFAAADVAVSGDARMGVVGAYNTTTAKNVSTFSSRVRFSFSGSGTTDGGLAFGGSARADNASGAASGISGSTFISGAFGKITMGDVDGGDETSVGQLASVGWDGAGYANSINYSTDGGDMGGSPGTSDGGAARVLYTYSAGALTMNASTAQLTNGGATSYGIGGSYAAGGLTVGVGYGSVDGLTLTGLKAYDSQTAAGVNEVKVANVVTVTGVAPIVVGFYDTSALAASVTDVSLSASYVIDNTTIKAIYQTKTIEASAAARADVTQVIGSTGVNAITTAVVHGHGAINLSTTATSMGLSVVQKMDALTLTAYGINTTVDADSDQSADNPTVSRYGIGFGYSLGGGATVSGGWAKYDSMTPTPIATAPSTDILQTYTLTSVSRNTWDLGVKFAF
jgi:outer membrane protein OmpU